MSSIDFVALRGNKRRRHLRSGRDSTDSNIVEPVGCDLLAVQCISPIDDQRPLDERCEPTPIDLPELFPLGKQHNGIGSLGCLVSVGAICNVGKNCPRLFDGLGVIGANDSTFGQQGFHERDGGCEADIVGVRLECQPPHGDLLATHNPQFFSDFLDEMVHASFD